MSFICFFSLINIIFLSCASLAAFFINLYIEHIYKVYYHYFHFIFIYVFLFTLYICLNFNFLNFVILDLNFNFMQIIFFFNIILLILVIALAFCWLLFYYESSFFFFNEFYIILSFIAIAFQFILISADFLFLYLGIELLSFCTYIFASFTRFGNIFVEAVLKYFLIGTFASCFMLYGLSLFYWIFVTTSFIDVCCYLELFLINNFFFKIFLISLTLIFITFFIKLALGPFGLWIADLYQGTALPFIFLVSTIIKIVFYIYLLIFIWCFFFDCINYFWITFEIINLLSLIIGNFFSISERSLIRLISYSTLPNIGLFSCFNIFSYNEILNLNVFFFLVYILNFVILFLPFFKQGSLFYKQKFSWDLIEFIVLKKNKFFFTLWIMAFFSLSGMPPFLIFFFKFTSNLNFFFESELFVLVIYLFSILSMYYYNYVLISFFFKKGFFLFLQEDILINDFFHGFTSTFFNNITWQFALSWQMICMKLLPSIYLIQPFFFFHFFSI